ncbi:MAG: DNA-3-methyladenine glycosylase [Halobacteriaceae archaeon]
MDHEETDDRGSCSLLNTITNQDFFRRKAKTIASDLIGMALIRSDIGVGGIIVETEAYINQVDPASHLAAGRTSRTEPFYSGPGTVYIFTIFGHDNLNFISEYHDNPEGILLRAVKPNKGVSKMQQNRDIESTTKLAAGPGRLTEAFDITQEEFNDRSLFETPLCLYETDYSPKIQVTSRVGISEADDWPLRFVDQQSKEYLSQSVTDESLNHRAVRNAYEQLESTNRNAQ